MVDIKKGDIIRVLIVDDSRSVREALRHILESDPSIRVMGGASNGREALEMIARDRPDIITMDMSMPEMDGEETTRVIMETNPIPIIVITASLSAREVKNTYRAIEAGALTVIQKPYSMDHVDHQLLAKEIIRNIRSLAHIKLVKRKKSGSPVKEYQAFHATEPPGNSNQTIRHVAIGASTGGPPVIQSILQNLPVEISATIYLVQHISVGFQEGFVEWLSTTTPHLVEVPLNGTLPKPGQVFMAPENSHMGIDRQGRIRLIEPGNTTSICPSVSHLFQSLAENAADSSMGVLLTGMGKDGAKELLMLKNAGGITVAQDRESSVIFGMPGEAVKLGAAQQILPADQISIFINTLICNTMNKHKQVTQ